MINKNLLFISFIFLFMFAVVNVNAGWTTNSSEQAYYFIEHDESGDPLADGSIWINGSFDDTSFYVYYNGDSYNSDYDNGDNVFEFFDDFDYPNNAINTSKWTCVDNTCAVSNSIGSQAAPSTSGTYGMRTNSVYDKNDNFHFYCKIQEANYGIFGTAIRDVGGAGKFDMKRYAYHSTDGGWITSTYASTAPNNFQNKISATGYADYFKAEMRQYGTSYVEFYHDGNLINNHTDKIPLTDGYIFILGLNNKYVYCDWIFNSLRNTYSTSYGSEESGSWEIDGITYTKRKEVEITGTFDGQIELDYDEFNSENITITTGIYLISIVSPTDTEYFTSDILINITNSTEVDKIWYNWNGTNVTYTNPVTVTFPAGEQTLYAWANNTSGDEQGVSVTFNVYLNPTPASFNHSVQLVRNDNNITLSWTLGNDTYELTNQTLYIFDLNNNLINNYSLLNTTTTYNYTNNITNVYYAILETCNIYPLCSNSTISNKFSFQSIEFVEWPTLVTSLETYNIKTSVSKTNILFNDLTPNTTYSNPCFACIGEPSSTSYRMGVCGNETGNLLYCDGSREDPPYDQYICITDMNPVCKYVSSSSINSINIFRNETKYNTTYVNPYYQTSFNAALYENQTYSLTAKVSYILEDINFDIYSDTQNLTIYNFSLGECSDASGFINYTLVDENEGLMTGDIGTFIRIHQPLGDINATLNMSSDNHLQFCITPKKNYTLSSDIYYIADAIGRTEEYYLNDAVYDTTQDNILYLYNLNNTDILNVVVLDEFSSKQIGSVVNLIKFYPKTMSSKTIASAKTNSEGEVNFFYDRNDQIKLTVVEDGITEYQDSEFNKYYSITGYYSRTVKLGSGILPTIDNINFDCQTSVVNETNNMVYCWFVVTDGKQRNFSLWVYDSGFNYIDILNGSYANSTSYETTGIYTTDGSLYISSDVLSGLYEFKIDGITRKSGVLNYNGSAVPVELKYLTLPFVFLVLILGAINPFFALGGFFILGLFSDPTTSTFMFFDNNFILGSVVAIIIAFVIEEVKAVTKKR